MTVGALKVLAMKMKSPLLIVAGAKGAVGTSVAAGIAVLREDPENRAYLTTAHWLPDDYFSRAALCGWDRSEKSVGACIAMQGIVPTDRYETRRDWLDSLDVRKAPDVGLPLRKQVDRLRLDIGEFAAAHPRCHPVMINLLPACETPDLTKYGDLRALHEKTGFAAFPDLAYILAAIESGVPVVNFTSNDLEVPLLIREAEKMGVPWCGRDGKTGQTYLKVVIASALRARNLFVEGWYSLNILGNDDGRNLADPRKASGKLANKTTLLDNVLGYEVGARYGCKTHKVAIDYYPPRGDAKEAWDVIDMTGMFGLPMSLRLNMQLRDSILAAPMVIDLAAWMAALQLKGYRGLVPELAFYFKKAIGTRYPVSFQDQVKALYKLEKKIRAKEGMNDITGDRR